MTREEAVEVLKERYLTCVGIGLDNHANRVNEAIDMAIEALQREEAEAKGYCHRIKPRTDLISRADAIDAICKSGCYVTYMDCPHADDGFRCDGCDDIEAIEALPSALADIGDYADRLWKIAYERGKAEAEAVPLRSDCAECSLKAINRKLDEESYEKGYTAGQFADRQKGEWIIRENGNKECSLCGHERQDGWDYFCGYCGAIMKGGADE